MWLHEQYITAYPDLLDDFWDKQKDNLITVGAGGVIGDAVGPPPAGPPPEEVSAGFIIQSQRQKRVHEQTPQC